MALRFKASLDDSDFQNRLRSMESGVVTRAAKMQSAFSSIGVSGALGGLLGGGLLLRGAEGAIDRLSRIKDQADSINLPIEEFQRLGFVFQQAGADADVFQKGMANLTNSFAAARDITSKQAEAMSALGLSLRTTNEADATGAMADLADAYANSTDKGAAFAAIADLVGSKVAIKMIPALVDGGAELRRIADSANVASEEMVRFVEEMGDKVSAAQTSLTNKVQGGWYLIGKAAVDGFKEGVNRGGEMGLPDWLQKITGAAGAVFGGANKALGIGEQEGSDPEQLKRIEQQEKDIAAKKEAIRADVDKRANDAREKSLKEMHARIEKEEAEYNNKVYESEVKSAEESAKKKEGIAKAQADYAAAMEEKANRESVSRARETMDAIDAEIQTAKSKREDLVGRIRDNPHHFQAEQKREEFRQRQAERKADRMTKVNPADINRAADARDALKRAETKQQATIADASIQKLVAAFEKAVLK